MASIKDKFAISKKGEPEKSFIKVGITDIAGNLTMDGETLFRQWLFESNKADFKKDVVDAIIAYDKAEKKESAS